MWDVVSAFWGELRIKPVLQHVLWSVRSCASWAVMLKLAQEQEVKSHRKYFTRQTVKHNF